MNGFYLYPLPDFAEKRDGKLMLAKIQRITVPESFGKERRAFYAELYQKFTLGLSRAEFVSGKEGEIIIGGYKGLKTYDPADDFTISVEESGAYLAAAEENALSRAFTSFLQMIRPEGEIKAVNVKVACGFFRERAKVKFRGVHFCVFPTTSLDFLKQFIRLSGFYRYTHFVVEFWGTYAFECFPALGWAGHSYSRSELKKYLDEARWLGMEVVPFFNHLGHASQSRVNGADHVVLGQDPLYAPLFEPDGWTWCVSNPAVRNLLKDVRSELCELAGDGGYFHIGMDEAFSFATCERCAGKDKKRLFADYVNEIAADLKKSGRRAILWGDQLLEGKAFSSQYTTNQVEESGTCGAIELLDKSVVIADWQYDIREGEINTTAFFKEQGYDTLGSPWEDPDNIAAHIRTAKKYGTGVLLTTWNATHPFIARLLQAAEGMCSGEAKLTYPELMSVSGNILRKISEKIGEPGNSWLGTRTLF